MKKLFLVVFLCSAFLLMGTTVSALPLPGAPSGAGISPYVVDGNPTAFDLGFGSGFKIDPPSSGIYTFPDGINTVNISSDGIYFDWTSTLSIDAVIVKGGPVANVYEYDPALFSDTLLHAPINPNNGKYYGLSHIEFAGAPVPEPATLLLLGGGLVGLAGFGRKKFKK